MLKITASVISGIFDHAKAEAPMEVCGYLAEKEGVIVQQYKMKNMDASDVHFAMDPEEQFEAIRDMRAKGFELAAVYHSHPTTSAHPSPEDIRLAYDPDVSYVIVSLAGGSEVLKSFKIRDNRVEPEKIDIFQDSPSSRSEPVSDAGEEVFRDYRGVICPMNFVKVKIDLANMVTGQTLKVLLDDGAPIRNVPRSVADEEHEIVAQKKEGDHWSVIIKKS
jgi:proteasome lid subunit RPN8/RPN11/TusA-related sulfurtransferase